MNRIALSLSTVLLLAASSILAAADKETSPLTPEIKAKLHAEVITIVAGGFL